MANLITTRRTMFVALGDPFPDIKIKCPCNIFSTRQHAERAICYRPSIRPSVCPSHGWISRKRLKLGSCNFHHTVAPSLQFLQDKFHPEIRMGSPRAGASNKGGYVASSRAIQYVMSSFATRQTALSSCDTAYFFNNSAEFTRSAKLLHYFAINDIHAEIYSAVVYFSDSVLNYIFLRLHEHRFKTRQFSYRPTN